MLQLFIGFRYLLRSDRGSRAPVLALVSAAVLAIGVAIFWALPDWGGLGVTLLGVGVLGVIVFGLTSLFTVFTSVSIGGVVLGVAALTVVLSVNSGFLAALREKVLGVNAHVLIRTERRPVSWREVEKVAAADPRVAAAEPFTMNEMLVTGGSGGLSGIAMKGVDPKLVGKVLDIPQHITEGSLNSLERRAPLAAAADNGARETGEADLDAPPPIIIGRGLAAKLNVKLGEDVTIVSPDANNFRAPGERARTQKFRVGAIFHSGFDEYDRRLVYVNIEDAQEFLQLGGEVFGIELRLHDMTQATTVARHLTELFPSCDVNDWSHLNENLFRALKLQRVVLLIFMTLIIVVAAFNIVAALTLIVFEKTREIAILKSMGMKNSQIAGIFIAVGASIGIIGTSIGVGFGLLLCKVVAKYAYPLNPGVYLIDKLPVLVSGREVLVIAALTWTICMLATLFPAQRAARLDPAVGLRTE